MKLLLRQIPVLVILACLVPVTLVIKDSYLWLDTSAIIAIYALLALSAGVSYGLAGILSVAQASLASIGAYATAIVTIRYGWSPYLSLILSITLPALLAYPVARAVNRLSPLALAIATLFFGQLADLAIRNGGDFTGNYIGLSGIPFLPGLSSPLAFHLTSWGIVCVVAFLYGNLIDSGWGRAMATLRYDSLRAAADGIDVPFMRSVAFALAATVAGLAGWLYAHHGAYLSPDSLATSQSLSALLMAVIGGSQFVLGPILGATMITLVLGILPGQELTGMFFGGLLIIVLVAMPRGLIGAVADLARHITRSRKPSGVAAAAPKVVRAPRENAVLDCVDLTARYGPITVCHGVSFSAGRGERLLLLGPNGAGKSSLLGAIAGSVASSGRVVVAGKIIRRGADQRARDGVAYVPEIRGNMFPTMSIKENLRSGLRLLPVAEQEQAYRHVVEMFPILAERATTQARMLSGGEQQMLAIAMAAARKPAVLLLDEPSQGLAPSVYGVLCKAFDRLSKDGIALVIAEQNIRFAASVASRCIVLKGGRLVAQAGPELLADPERIAAMFLHDEQPAPAQLAPGSPQLASSRA
jgi:branched-chain amino acid transport system permease protein